MKVELFQKLTVDLNILKNIQYTFCSWCLGLQNTVDLDIRIPMIKDCKNCDKPIHELRMAIIERDKKAKGLK
jgi:hypothetical protein